MVIRMVRTRICGMVLLILAGCSDDDDGQPLLERDAGDAPHPPRSDGGITDASVDAKAEAGCNPAGAPCADSADALKCCSHSCTVSSSSPSVCF